MVVFENQCTGCSDLGIPCLGMCCPNRKVPVFYCDNHNCPANHDGTDRLFRVADSQLCMDCVEEIAARICVDLEDIIEGEL